MASGFHGLVPGEKVPAATFNDFYSKQGVMVFTSATDRDTQLTGVLREGMVAYLIDLDKWTVYSGSAWSTIGPLHGPMTSYTPTLVQSGAVTKTVNRGKYTRFAREIRGDFNLGVTAAGGASFPVLVGLPVAAFATAGPTDVIGNGYIRDASAGIKYRGMLVFIDTLQVQFLTTHSTTDGYLGNVDFTAALASGDQVSGTFRYEAAADQ